MKPFWPAVNKVIKESHIIIEVLDARFPEFTRNVEIEDKIKKWKKEGYDTTYLELRLKKLKRKY